MVYYFFIIVIIRELSQLLDRAMVGHSNFSIRVFWEIFVSNSLQLMAILKEF